MASVPADDYIERLSRYIQANSKSLAAAPLGGRRPPSSSTLWPGSAPAKPLSLRITPHNLYYLLLRFEAIGLDVGRLDVRLGDDARRAISFVEPRTRDPSSSGRLRDWSETGSFRSMTSAVSSLSLGGWWATSKVVDPDATLKLIYSAFTKLPSLVVHAAGLGDDTIQEMESTGPLDCCVPLRIFRNLQLLEIHSLPPAALLVPSSPILRSVILRDLDSPTLNEEADWLVPTLFAEPGQHASSVGNGTPRGKVVRTRQPSAAADVMAGMDEEDEETSDSDSLRPPPTASSAPPPPPGLPTLARFVNLSHLALPHLSLVTLPRLPLPSVVSLDLSHNLLLELPANLVLLPSLVSLNLEGNMIQSLRGADQVLPAPSLASNAAGVRGTPLKRLRTATGLRVLNLDQNRIANLHGLAALTTLERLSIRDNRLSESQELHRLTVLPVLSDLYVCPQPFSALPAEEGWRVRLWEAFAREGRAEIDCAKVDGEGVGWNERRKMGVPFPATSHAAGSSSASRPVPKPRSPNVVPVGARRALSPNRSARDKQPLQVDVFASTSVASPASLKSPQPFKTGAMPSPKPKRRKQRIVNLDGSVEAVRRSGPVDGDESDVSAVVERPPRSPTKPTIAFGSGTSSPATLRVPTAHSSFKLPSASKSSHTRRALSSSVYAPAGPESSSPPGSSAAESGDEFRRKLEGLRSDVGDSWLRVLSAGGAGNAGGSGSESLSAGLDEPEDEPAADEEAPFSAPVVPRATVPILDEPATVADAPAVVQVVKKPPAKKKKAKGNGKKKG